MQRLTNSRMYAARKCLRFHYYRYELGLARPETAKPLRMGSAVHLGLELWRKGATQDEAILAACADYETVPAWVSDVDDWHTEREVVAVLLAGYMWHWGPSDDFEFIDVEAEFNMPLTNPDTTGTSRTFELAGKIDGIVRATIGRLYVYELKTTSYDLSAESEYWQRLRTNPQNGTYTIGARHLGHDVDGVLYDVIRKPTIRPRAIPILDDDGNKIVLDAAGDRVFNKTGKPRQTGGPEMTLQSRRESPEEYGARLLQDIQTRPEFYFARREIPTLADDVNELQHELWQQGQLILNCQNKNIWFKNVTNITCPHCEYSSLCYNNITVDPEMPPTGFEILEDVHPELAT